MTASVTVNVVRLDERARLPAYMSEGAAGLDVCACLQSEVTISPGRRALIGTGLSIAVPAGHEVQVRPRSGLAYKHGVTVLNSPGTIDSDYRGEVRILLVNHGEEPFVVRHGERIAQLVLAEVRQMQLVEVDGLDSTVRGHGGYGSTGT